MSSALGLGSPRGIFRMADSIGLGRIIAEVSRLYEMHNEDRYKVSHWLAKLVEGGKLGRKTGERIYLCGSP